MNGCLKLCGGLILLADGCNIEEVINEVVINSKGKVDISDVATALDRPESMAEFMVITDDDVLEAMLSAPMEQWRYFYIQVSVVW